MEGQPVADVGKKKNPRSEMGGWESMASLPKTNPGPFMKAVLRERRFNKQKNHLRSWGHSSKKKHRRFAPGGFVEPGRWNEERRKARRLLPSEAPRFPPSMLSQFEKRVVTSFRRGVVNFVENPWSTKLKSVSLHFKYSHDSKPTSLLQHLG